MICQQSNIQQQNFRGNSTPVSLPFRPQAVLCSTDTLKEGH